MNIQWQPEYSVGVKEIDAQHQHFIETLNAIYEELTNADGKIDLKKLDDLYNGLMEYATIHFSTEEKYFQMVNYENAEEHITEHRKLTDKLHELLQDENKYEPEQGFLIIDFLEDWLVNHLATQDNKYKEVFKAHGIS